jgi:hypothetical protein
MTVLRSVFVTVTVAFGTTAPLESVTVPTMVPVVSCAAKNRDPVAKAATMISTAVMRMEFLPIDSRGPRSRTDQVAGAAESFSRIEFSLA